MLEIADQHLCHGWEPPLSLTTTLYVGLRVLPGKLWHWKYFNRPRVT
jgi:hypothetical protein